MKTYLQITGIFFLSVFMLVSCSSYSQTRRGTLSEAVEKSSDDYKGDRYVSEYDEEENEIHDDEYSENSSEANEYLDDNTADTDSSGEKESDTIEVPFIGIKAFSSLKYSSKLGNETGGSLVWSSAVNDKNRYLLYLGGGVIPTNEKSDIHGSISQFAQIHVGFQFCRYLTPDHTLLGLYIPFDLTVKSLFWKYNNPVVAGSEVIDSETDTIQYDGLLGFSFASGIGATLVKTNIMQLSGELTAGGSLYGDVTYQDFKNDVMSGDLFIRFAIEVLFRYKNK